MLISDVLLWTLSHIEQRQDDQLEPTYNSSVSIRNEAQKTCRKQWTNGRGDKKRSGISAQMARHDDEEEGSYLSSNRNTPKSERIENAPLAILISTEQF